jgi:hypothetical protein
MAIGAVYMTYFYRELNRGRPCPLLEAMRNMTAEDYCHLALGILYPLSTVHV